MSTSQNLDQDASSGGIFEGVKFWLAHRMPDRANIIALVKAGFRMRATGLLEY